MSLLCLKQKRCLAGLLKIPFPPPALFLQTNKRPSVPGRHTVKHKHFPALSNFFKVKTLSPWWTYFNTGFKKCWDWEWHCESGWKHVYTDPRNKQTDTKKTRVLCTKFSRQQHTVARPVGTEHTSDIVRATGSAALNFWRRNYFFLILAHLYIKCE